MTYKLNKGFISQNQGEKTIIFDTQESKLHTLNPTASYIFKKLRKQNTDKQIIESIAKNYSIEIEEAEEDFKKLIIDLQSKGIIY